MFESINGVISDYLEASNTDYAIMISGEWGCGKSHYIHHDFEALVKTIAVPVDDEKEKKVKVKYYKPAFVSLYGVSSAEDFEYRVFCGVNSWADKGIIRVGGTILNKGASFFGLEFNRKDAASVTFVGENLVLVFDDLERICDDKIPVKEVLGLINSYAEHTHRKVIIVCNEVGFSGDEAIEDGAEKKKREDYKKYKEKSVRFTYKFIPDEASVYDVMVNKLPESEYKQYLIRQKDSVLALFRIGGEKNLRTLKFFIDTFGKIHSLTHGVNYREQIIRTYLVSFMLYVCEYKRGHTAKELNVLDSSQYRIDTSIFRKFRDEELPQSKGETDDYVSKFQETYNAVFSEFKPSRLLIDYIETGSLDNDGLLSEIKKHDKELQQLEVTEEGRVYQRLLRMTELDDNDVDTLLDEMISYIKADKYNLYELLHVYALLLKYDYWHINGFELTEAINDEFKASMQRQKDKHCYNNLFEVRTPIWDNSNRSSRQFKLYDDMKGLAMRINRDAKSKTDCNEGKAFLATAESGDVEKLRQYRMNPDNIISVSGLDWGKVVDLIKVASNPVACEVCDCVIAFIPGSGYLNPFETERVKKELIPALDDYLSNQANQIRIIYAQELRNHLASVIR